MSLAYQNNRSVFQITQSQNKDFDMTVNSFRNLAKTCKGCHQKFRN